MKIKNKKNCLVLIDIQKGFLTSETKAIIEKIDELFKYHKFDHIVATKFINTPTGPYVTLMGWCDLMDSESQQLHKTIEKKAERVFIKTIYTCVNDEFLNYLAENDIKKVYFAGIDTDGCVLKSAIDCFEHNIPLTVMIDYCFSTGGTISHNAGVEVLRRTIGKNCLVRGKKMMKN